MQWHSPLFHKKNACWNGGHSLINIGLSRGILKSMPFVLTKFNPVNMQQKSSGPVRIQILIGTGTKLLADIVWISFQLPPFLTFPIAYPNTRGLPTWRIINQVIHLEPSDPLVGCHHYNVEKNFNHLWFVRLFRMDFNINFGAICISFATGWSYKSFHQNIWEEVKNTYFSHATPFSWI